MAKCHYNPTTGHIPVCAVTDLEGNIVFSNLKRKLKYSSKDSKHETAAWVITGARTMVTRFWSSSTATVLLTADAPEKAEITTYFNERQFLENEFSIWMGYLGDVRPIQKKDLTDGRLLIVFTGVLENLKFTGSNMTGGTMELQFRDRMKWFMDSAVNFYQSEINSLDIDRVDEPENWLDNLNPFNKKNKDTTKGISRSDVIMALARRSIGLSAIEGTNSLGSYGAEVKKGIVYDLNDLEGNASFPSPAVFINNTQVSTYAGPTTQTLPPKLLPTYKNNRIVDTQNRSGYPPISYFHIYTARRGVGASPTTDRPSFAQASETTLFLVNNQITIEAIKTLAFQEVNPTELYQDHRTGDMFYSPRLLITNSYNEPTFNHRVYMYNPPMFIQDLTKDTFNINNFLLGYREESSTIGVKTNFIVSNASINYDGDPFKAQTVNLHLKTAPPSMTDYFASKFMRIQDPTIQGHYEAMAVAINMARIHARETNAGMAVMLGDPTFVPGELIKVLGSPYYPMNGYADINNKPYTDVKALILDGYTQIAEYQDYWTKFITTMASESFLDPDGEFTSDIPPNLDLNIIYGEAANPDDRYANLKTNYNEEITDYVSTLRDKNNQFVKLPDLPASMWRIEAVMHKFNLGTKGYTTELALVKPY